MGQRKWKEYCSSSAAWMTQEGKIAWNGDNCLMFMTIMLWIPSDLSTNSTSAAFCHALTLLLFLIFILFIQRTQEKKSMTKIYPTKDKFQSSHGLRMERVLVVGKHHTALNTFKPLKDNRSWCQR